MTLSPRALKASALYYKRKLYNKHLRSYKKSMVTMTGHLRGGQIDKNVMIII